MPSIITRPRTGLDDADQLQNGTDLRTSGIGIEIVDGADTSTRRDSAIRFPLVNIAQGDTVSSATVTVKAGNDKVDSAHFDVYGHDADNSLDFLADATIQGRTLTTATVAVDQDNVGIEVALTINVTSIVQEIVNRPGWKRGHAITLIFKARSTGAEQFNPIAWDAGSDNHATLDATFTSAVALPTYTTVVSTEQALYDAYSVAVAGTTIFVRGDDFRRSARGGDGRLRGRFYFNRSGTATDPITVKPYSGEKVTFEFDGSVAYGSAASNAIIYIDGDYNRIEDFDFRHTPTARPTQTTSPNPLSVVNNGGVGSEIWWCRSIDINGFHANDGAGGGRSFYGCLALMSGSNNLDHSFYIKPHQTDADPFLLRHCLGLIPAAYAFHGYSNSANGSVRGLHIEQSVGACGGRMQEHLAEAHRDSLLMAVDTGARSTVMDALKANDCHLWQYSGRGGGIDIGRVQGITSGHGAATQTNMHGIISQNPADMETHAGFTTWTSSGNTWRRHTDTQPANSVHYWADDYRSNSGIVVIDNAQQSTSISITPSFATVGQALYIFDAMHPDRGAVYSTGSWDGTAISIPMAAADRPVQKPSGGVTTPASTAPMLGVLLVSDTPDLTAPKIAEVAPAIPAPIVLGQHRQQTNSPSSSAYTYTTGTNTAPTDGSLVFVDVVTGDTVGNSPTHNSVTDTFGDTGGTSWTRIEGVYRMNSLSGQSDWRVSTWYRIIGTGAGAGTVSISLSRQSYRTLVGVSEWTNGFDAASPIGIVGIDVSTTTDDGSVTPDFGAVPAANSAIHGSVVYRSTTSGPSTHPVAADTGYTQSGTTWNTDTAAVSGGHSWAQLWYKIGDAPQTFTATYTTGAGTAHMLADGVEIKAEPTTTTVGKSLDARWSARATVAKPADLRWGVRSTVADTLDLQWAISVPVGDAVDTRWAVRQAVGDAADVRWGVRHALGSALDTRWAVRSVVGDASDLRWALRALAGDSVDARWAVRTLAGDALDARWALRALASDTLDLRWALSQTAGDALDARWGVRALVGDAADLRWDVQSTAGVAQSVSLLWDVRAATQATSDLQWALRSSVGKSADTRWAVRSLASASLDQRWSVRQAVADSLDARWAIRERLGTSSDLRWALRDVVGKATALEWAVRAAVGSDADLDWAVRALVADAVSLRWDVYATGSVATSLSLLWETRAAVASDLDQRWDVHQTAAKSLDARWALRDTVGAASDLRWAQRALVGDEASFQWATRTLVGDAADLRWAVNTVAAADPVDLRWALRGTASASTELRWALRAIQEAQADLQWDVRAVTGDQLDLAWAVTVPVAANPIDLRWQIRALAGLSLGLQWRTAPSTLYLDLTIVARPLSRGWGVEHLTRRWAAGPPRT